MRKGGNFQPRKFLVVGDKDWVNVGVSIVERVSEEIVGTTSFEKALEMIRKESSYLLAVVTEMNIGEKKKAGRKIVRECVRRGIPVILVVEKKGYLEVRCWIMTFLGELAVIEASRKEVERVWRGLSRYVREKFPVLDAIWKARDKYERATGKPFFWKGSSLVIPYKDIVLAS